MRFQYLTAAQYALPSWILLPIHFAGGPVPELGDAPFIMSDFEEMEFCPETNSMLNVHYQLRSDASPGMWEWACERVQARFDLIGGPEVPKSLYSWPCNGKMFLNCTAAEKQVIVDRAVAVAKILKLAAFVTCAYDAYSTDEPKAGNIEVEVARAHSIGAMGRMCSQVAGIPHYTMVWDRQKATGAQALADAGRYLERIEYLPVLEALSAHRSDGVFQWHSDAYVDYCWSTNDAKREAARFVHAPYLPDGMDWSDAGCGEYLHVRGRWLDERFRSDIVSVFNN